MEPAGFSFSSPVTVPLEHPLTKEIVSAAKPSATMFNFIYVISL
jgi:hypothetical protein